MSHARSLPADRSHVATEQRHSGSAALDTLATSAIVDLMIDDHRQVIEAAKRAAPVLSRFIDGLAERMRQGGRLIYLGAGTSGRLGVLDASECPPTFQADPGQIIGLIAGGDASLRKSSEGREDEPEGAAAALAELRLTSLDTALGIAAGGTTPYVLGAIRIAKRSGAVTGLLTCAKVDPPPADCDHMITLEAGPEILTGSTRLKAGSATKLALNVITTAAFVRLGKTYGNLMVDLRATNAKLTDRAIRIVIAACGDAPGPSLTREEAATLLRRADGKVKAAIVMHRLKTDLAAAEALLAKHAGRLRDVLSAAHEP